MLRRDTLWLEIQGYLCLKSFTFVRTEWLYGKASGVHTIRFLTFCHFGFLPCFLWQIFIILAVQMIQF